MAMTISRRPLGLCLEPGLGFVTFVPRTGAMRQALEAWGRQHPALPLLVEKPGWTKDEEPRCWHGYSVRHRVEVKSSEGRGGQEAVRFVVVPSRQLAPQHAQTYANAPAKEAETVADHVRQVHAVEVHALPNAEVDNGWTVLATTVRAERGTDAEILAAYQEQHTTVEPGFRWLKNPAASAPVWREKPDWRAALALRTVVGLLVSSLIQRQVRLSLCARMTSNSQGTKT